MNSDFLLKSVLTKILLPLLFLLAPNLCMSQSYVTVIVDETEIQVEPEKDAKIVSKAYQGDIFEVISQNDDWIEINLFSGEYRYINVDAVKETEELQIHSESLSVKQRICRELVNSEDRAMRYSTREYPNDFMKQIDYERILTDRYKLEIFRKDNIPTPYYSKLLIECVEKGWD